MLLPGILLLILGLFGIGVSLFGISGLIEKSLNLFDNPGFFFGLGRDLSVFDYLLYLSVILTIAGLVFLIIQNKKKDKAKKTNVNIKTLTECAVMLALATVLSMMIIYEAPLGGSVTLFSMVPIIIIAFRHGVKWGLGTAFTYSVIQLLMGLKNLAYIPTPTGVIMGALFDYIVAFTILGFAGVFMKIKFTKNSEINKIIVVIAGVLLVCILRYASHVLVGATLWYEITKNGDWNEYVRQVGMWTYSLVYNISFMLPETIITFIATPLVVTFGLKKNNDTGKQA